MLLFDNMAVNGKTTAKHDDGLKQPVFENFRLFFIQLIFMYKVVQGWEKSKIQREWIIPGIASGAQQIWIANME